MNTGSTQANWIERAHQVLPAGGFGNFDPDVVIREGKGARVWDVDGTEYVDLLIGSGPMLLGHGNEEVLSAVHAQLDKGMTFFATNALGIELAEEICAAVACADQVRFVSTGGEADMYAMRLARAATGRDKIVKFEGGYHGMCAEAQMSLSPTRLVNFPNAVPDSAGIPVSVQNDVLVAPFNDVEFVRSLAAEHADEIAAIIVEPLQRIIPPEPGFLEELRHLCDAHGIILIFDEVVTGFRLEYGGAQERYGVIPDLCTLGKVIGGGFPLAAIAGHHHIMKHFDKADVGAEGFLMQVGTLSGNPVAAIAGLKTMEILKRPGRYDDLKAIGEALQTIFATHLSKAGIAHQISGDATLFDVVFIDRPVRNYRDVIQADGERSATFNAGLRSKGILKSPGKVYPSLALTQDDLARIDEAVDYAARTL